MKKKMHLTFDKAAPSFLTKIRQQFGYKQVTIQDKFKQQSDIEDYDINNAQVINQDLQQRKQLINKILLSQQLPPQKQQQKPVDINKFKPVFLGKKEKSEKIVQMNIRKNQEERQGRREKKQQSQEEVPKKIPAPKTKKISKPNKNLLSFDD